MSTVLSEYLEELGCIYRSGAATDEKSYYPALTNTLAAVGRRLKPAVHCVQEPKNKGAGHPDIALYTKNQLKNFDPHTFDPLVKPERGVIEVKGFEHGLDRLAASEQVTKYWSEYGLVLCTNYREFVLVGRDQFGNKTTLERLELAADAAGFREMLMHPRQHRDELARRFEEFLTRTLLHNTSLNQPKDVAWFLASYARDALARIEGIEEPEVLGVLRKTLEEALGITFEGEKGGHFFHSTLVQTLFYGLFSAWVAWCKTSETTAQRKSFDPSGAAWLLRLPVLRALFEHLNTPGKLGPLSLHEVMEWAAAVLRRVDDKAFFATFHEDHAVQYFYEPFLEAYDPELRKDLGVWYTPPEVVDYMVERVDHVLRTELGCADGLADPNVLVLDPCCGTGSYIVSVLDRIRRTLEDKHGDGLIGSELIEAARKRVFGFEILPAPFVVAHLQVGLLLEQYGADLTDAAREVDGTASRPAIYLSNALVGWDGDEPAPKLPMFPEIADEIDLAREVKQDKRIIVVLGNPPYNAYAGTSPDSEGDLVEPYKEGLVNKWKIRKFNLDELYVRFFRIAERRIAELSKLGVVCYISNFSYLGDASFVVMRERLLKQFDSFWFDCLNGDSRETGKLTPDGKPDPSIFSTEHNREGIRVGTAIGLMVRRHERAGRPVVRFRHFWGKSKRKDLVASLDDVEFDETYDLADPTEENRYSFRSMNVSQGYMVWPKLTDLSRVHFNGLMEKRGGALIDIDSESLKRRMTQYFDPTLSLKELAGAGFGLARKYARFDPEKTREIAIKTVLFSDENVRRYVLRPFDVRWCYYTNLRPIWNEPRPNYVRHLSFENGFLMSRPSGVSDPEGVPFFWTRILGDNDFMRGHAYYFPCLEVPDDKKKDKGAQENFLARMDADIGPEPNLSLYGCRYLKLLNMPVDKGTELVWFHALAIGYSPAYLRDNADGIRQDWPRVPLPTDASVLRASAALGREVAALLDTEAGVDGVTTGTLRPELKVIGRIERVGGGNLGHHERSVTAGWGNAGQNGVTMPGKGDARSRTYDDDERAAMAGGAAALELSPVQAMELLGEQTYDIHLNDHARWRNVPAHVWDYVIGGYQVIKKWLSYRELSLLGRPLSIEEARYVGEVARRLAALRLLEPRLDANYLACRDIHWDRDNEPSG